ncbi:MAG: TetR/AcrR family transcriptional regulator [Alphaproteobacteria bacterium]|nr:TetR/AcrR family transcriptional regulator [Alphaproteobacteria bacterium]
MGSPGHTANPEEVHRKAAYHHGDLREALLAATHRLVTEKGPEHFTLADACRLAGVSTAAPYRHFRDREEVLGEITARGFEELERRMRAAKDAHPRGEIAAISAMGQAYVAFAREEPAVFRLMFGRRPEKLSTERVQAAGQGAFGTLLEEVEAFQRARGLARDVMDTAVPLWTFVHGAASLMIDGDYEKVAPETDIGRMIDDATRQLLHFA